MEEKGMMSPGPQQPPPVVQICLSRPAYQLGSSVVGTVRVSWSNDSDHKDNNNTAAAVAPPVRTTGLVSLQLYAAGRCRIDPRWHQVANYVKLYGPTHPNLNLRTEQRVIQAQLGTGTTTAANAASLSISSSSTTTLSEDPSQPLQHIMDVSAVMDMQQESSTASAAASVASSVVCFWATNVVELLELPERSVGAWDQVKPKPIKLHGVQQTDDKQQPSPPQQQQQGQEQPTTNATNNNDNDNTTTSTSTATTVTKHHPGHIEKHAQPSSSSTALDEMTPFVHEPNTNTTRSNSPTLASVKDEHLLFTFRIDLPDDIPPTFTAASCRYFYSVVVCAKFKSPSTAGGHHHHNNHHSHREILVHAPLTLIFSTSSLESLSSSSTMGGRLASTSTEDPTRRRSHNERVKIGTCVAMAHSSGLPCHVSATDMQRRHAGLMTVRRNRQYPLGDTTSSYSNTSSPTAGRTTRTTTSAAANNIPTLRVADPFGNPCCILTVIGDTMKWIPGSRVILQLDFPNPRGHAGGSGGGLGHRRRRRRNHPNQEENNDEDAYAAEVPAPVWIPCYQASACLTAQEVAVYEDGSKKRTKFYSLDTCHETIDPHCAERVCLTLFLPLDCPCTVQTDLVEISVQCRVDITVGASTSSSNNAPAYTNLRLDLPCCVVQGNDESNDDEEDEDGYNTRDDERNVNSIPLHNLLFGSDNHDHDHLDHNDANREKAISRDKHLFEKKDILKDLKVLSLHALDYYP